jgi:ATP-dependent DNA ligase
MGLEGIVSKRLSAPYRSGPSRDWIKVKNPDSQAMMRVREERCERQTGQRNLMTIDAGEGAFRTVIAGAIVESYDAKRAPG